MLGGCSAVMERRRGEVVVACLGAVVYTGFGIFGVSRMWKWWAFVFVVVCRVPHVLGESYVIITYVLL